MTEAQMYSLVMRHVERTGDWPDELVMHPVTLSQLIREHSIPVADWLNPRPSGFRVSILGVPVEPDPYARRGTLYIRQRIRPPRGVPCL